MPEDLRILLAKAMAAAFAVAAAVVVHCGRSWRAPRRVRVSAGLVLGIGIGFYAGCWFIGPAPRWPPKADQDRLLFVLFPAVLFVELEAIFARRALPVAWLARLVVVAGAARILLHNSVYLADLSGPASAEWTPAKAVLWLGGMAAALAIVWTLLAVLMRRAPGRAVPLALALTCTGAGGSVMLSGYASGGMLGLSLAAALAGAVAGSLVLPRRSDLHAVIGPAIVGLFSLLVIGHFFAELTISHAVLLFSAPLLSWLPELPLARRAWSWLRAVARVSLVAVLVAVVVVQARQSFAKAQASSGTRESTIVDESARDGFEFSQ
jgi:hypothetical protein